MRMSGRVLTGVLLFLAASTPALAKEGSQKDPQKHLDRLTKQLELTDQQRSQVEQTLNDYHGRMDLLRDQMESLRKEKHEKINAALTPEQQEKFAKIKRHKSKKGLLGWFRKSHS